MAHMVTANADPVAHSSLLGNVDSVEAYPGGTSLRWGLDASDLLSAPSPEE
ncbi:hypothetical protein SPRG_17069 [Saprolegnia parasitica CBS 223.65]|uniref:Uncharacterized protein n=1 Tax=Saprolegnia parasitica (strain CBS 223.65) TaxID=695850 RepID=A0A067BGQ8_SAPPC|nr:hypothetical protein SPRG_17069 [Saprolegnia parasitica CBS 223.65]KDO17328.1 hypothetical protein SPRG_17069 [Saprolegnia parasitica CBS 223.65]|eukprot:XP_012211964.1 hypothetical protein SPRG_17069 [Saprolegnia parasitica CBS 223.65]